MNCVLSIIAPQYLSELTDICKQMKLPVNVIFHGRGTAMPNMLDLLGIESNERRIVLTVANQEKTEQLIQTEKNQFFIGVPGHGIIVSVPIKSIGGGSTVAYVNAGQMPAKQTPHIDPAYELVVVIANEGRTDLVMNAARSAGAAGGTVLHGRGTGASDEKFMNVSIAREKETVLIVAKAENKAGIMQAILQKAGPSSEAGSVVFSLPVNQVAGFGMFSEQ